MWCCKGLWCWTAVGQRKRRPSQTNALINNPHTTHTHRRTGSWIQITKKRTRARRCDQSLEATNLPVAIFLNYLMSFSKELLRCNSKNNFYLQCLVRSFKALHPSLFAFQKISRHSFVWIIGYIKKNFQRLVFVKENFPSPELSNKIRCFCAKRSFEVTAVFSIMA